MLLLLHILLLVLALLYFSLFLWWLNGWKKLPVFAPPESEPQQLPKFSIIIPARNEEASIAECLNDLLQQDLRATHYEVLVVDDHSTDRTAAVVAEIAAADAHQRVKLLTAPPEESDAVAYKKRALEKGIEAAQYPWIITTDADCQRRKSYLQTVAAFIQQHEPQLVSAPVSFHQEQSAFQRMQTLEFLGLIGIGAASIQHGQPNMCNGANLIFSKDAYEAVGGYSGLQGIASGDDELLMHRIHQCFPGQVRFLKSLAATVFTKPASSLGEFLRQRKRWASKGSHYESAKLRVVVMLVGIFYLLLLVLLLNLLFFPDWWKWVVPALLLKWLGEALFLARVTRFFGRGKLMWLFLPASPLQLLYVVFTGLWAQFGGYTWKGRKVR